MIIAMVSRVSVAMISPENTAPKPGTKVVQSLCQWRTQDFIFGGINFFMAALCNRAGHIYFHAVVSSSSSLWPPYVIGWPLYFCPVISIYRLSSIVFFLSSPNLSGRRLDVYRTLTHGVALVRI